MAHKVFEKPIRVHFSNCDPAGIVFHPQYFVLINELMEDFLEDVAGGVLLKSAATVWVSQW